MTGGDDVVVRPIELTDIEGFRSVLDAVCRERKYLGALTAPSIERVTEFVSGNVEKGWPQFVAVHDGAIVGWCDATPGSDDTGTSHVGGLGMGLLPGFRGQGVGQRLMEATINRSRELGLQKIELWVFASNLRATRLYQKLGFEVEGVKKRGRYLDGEYDDVVLMALHLVDP